MMDQGQGAKYGVKFRRNTARMRPFSLTLLGLLVGTQPVLGANISQKPQKEEPMSDTRTALPAPEELAALPPDGGPKFNRLVFEKSPYLLQHAANPVDWYPWGPEAFSRAKGEEKPVFLSVGYATCHWCHVMARESFEDEEVAALLNRHFVSIKVDREERPDIDKIYMDATQAMTGQGGWPMTVVMTPDQRPFFAGTYFPKDQRYGRPGMLQILPQLAAAWEQDRDRVDEVAGRVTEAIEALSAPTPGDRDVGLHTIESAARQLYGRFDPQHGGFGHAPKFPTPHTLGLLLRHARRSGTREPVHAVTHTLREMRKGGIFDHIGLGFHRYSTDRQWLLPHFEKMLYDQALLAIAYIEAWQFTHDPFLAETAREIFRYVQRDMTAAGGGFYSAEDAESEGVEGKFYVWTTDEVRSILDETDAELFIRLYQLRDDGNFRHETGEANHHDNIPHLTLTLDEWAVQLDREPAALREQVERIRQTLFAARAQRVQPLKDDKVLTDWNGLMIAAFARGAFVLDDAELARAAIEAADFLLVNLQDDRGRLLKRYRNGVAGGQAHLEDYAFFAWGLTELFEATGEVRFLREALRLADLAIAHFWDDAAGGFFQTADDGERLLVRAREAYDGAMPSGNSVMAGNLLRLAHLTGRMEYADRAEKTVASFAGQVERGPASFAQMLQAVDMMVGPKQEIVIAGERGAEDTQAMLQALRSTFLPNRVLLQRGADESAAALTALAPYVEAMESIEGKATAYLCENFACRQPTTDPAEFGGWLTP